MYMIVKDEHWHRDFCCCCCCCCCLTVEVALFLFVFAVCLFVSKNAGGCVVVGQVGTSRKVFSSLSSSSSW